MLFVVLRGTSRTLSILNNSLKGWRVATSVAHDALKVLCVKHATCTWDAICAGAAQAIWEQPQGQKQHVFTTLTAASGVQALASALAAGRAQAAGEAYAAALQMGGSAAAAATTVLATAISTANCNGVIVNAIASKPEHGVAYSVRCSQRFKLPYQQQLLSYCTFEYLGWIAYMTQSCHFCSAKLQHSRLKSCHVDVEEAHLLNLHLLNLHATCLHSHALACCTLKLTSRSFNSDCHVAVSGEWHASNISKYLHGPTYWLMQRGLH